MWLCCVCPGQLSSGCSHRAWPGRVCWGFPRGVQPAEKPPCPCLAVCSTPSHVWPRLPHVREAQPKRGSPCGAWPGGDRGCSGQQRGSPGVGGKVLVTRSFISVFRGGGSLRPARAAEHMDSTPGRESLGVHHGPGTPGRTRTHTTWGRGDGPVRSC